MTEWKLFSGEPPEFTTAEWYAGRERAAHLEQPGHRPRLLLAAEMARTLAAGTGARSVVDLGCGDGGLLTQLNGLRGWGYDLCPAAVDAARGERQVHAMLLDVVAEPGKIIWGELAVATETLEHLADPHAFVREIRRHCGGIVASSPWTETPDVHYEFHTWAWDMPGYRALIEGGGFTVTRHETVSGFQVISGVRS